MAETTRLEGVYTIRLENGPALRELEKFTKELFDVRAEKTSLTKETRNLIKEEKNLEAEIKRTGAATEDQAKRLADVRKRREENNRAVTEAITVERGLSGQSRELTNDLSKLTEQGLRFRDKMSDAFTKALEGSQIFQQLGTRAEFLEMKLKEGASAMEAQQQQIAQLNTQLQSGAKTEEQYAEEMRVLNEEIAKGKAGNEALQQELAGVTEKSAKLTAEVDALNKELREGKISQDEYRAGIAKIEEETRKAGVETANLTSRFDDFAKNQGRELKSSLSSLALQYVGVGAAVNGVVSIIGDALTTIKDFEKSLSSVSALGGDYEANIGRIADVTKTAGIEFGFTAVQSVEAVEALAKAGVEVEDILGGGLQGALTLAAAGGLSVADAAETASKAMTQFGLAGQDVTLIADLLANGANKATGDVSDFAQALNQSGQVAAQFGVPIEETIGTLTAFASAGLLGSDAGTSFRTMLIRLAKPTEDSAKAMEQLGIDTFDAQGQFVGIENLAGQLQTRLKDLTEEQRNNALAQIFGNDALRAAGILYNTGAEGIAKWTAEVSVSGEAARIAAEKTNNLAGDVDKLGATWDAAVLNGDSFGGMLRSLIQSTTDFIAKTNEASDSSLSFLERSAAAAESASLGVISKEGFLKLIEGVTFGNVRLAETTDLFASSIDKVKRAGQELVDATVSGDQVRIAAARSAFNAAREEQMIARQTTVVTEEVGKRTAAASETIAEARDRIAASIETEKAALEELATTDAEGIAAGKQRIVALEKELAALEGKTSVSKAAAAQEKKDLADIARLNDELTKARIESEQASLKPRQREEAQVAQVRDDRVQRAQGDADTLKAIEEQSQADLQAIREKYAKQDAELMASSEAQLQASLQRRNEQELAALDAKQTAELQQIERDGGDVHAALVRQQEERVALVLDSRRVQEEILTEQFNTDFAALDGQLIAQLDRQTQYEADLALMRAEFRASDLQAQVESSQAQLNAEQQLQDARISAIGGFANALGGLAEENSDLAKAFFLVEKAAAAADVIMKTQREIAGYYLAYSAIPGGPAIAGSLALAARIRSATSLAQILATTVTGFAGGGDVSGNVTSSWGPSVTRSNGDNVLVRAGSGYVTLKTGEKVLNQDQQEELERRTHKGIWGDIGLPGYTSTMTDFRKAQHIAAFADGGEIVGSITPRPSPSTIVNSQMVSSLEAFAERPMYVDVHEINSVQGKVSVQEQRSSL